MRSHWSNSMTAQAFICSKCTTLCCKGKFLVSYQTVKSWRILLFERKYVCWMYFCFFIKLTQGEWGLADPTQWQCKLSFAKNVRHLLQRKVFGSFIQGSNHEGFYYLKGNMYTECIFAFSQNWLKENEVSLTQLNDSAIFHLRKMYDIFCKGKFLVSYQRVKSWGILLFEKRYEKL